MPLPLAPDVIVAQPTLLAAVQAHPLGAVTATVQKSDGTTASVTVSNPTWKEATAGAFSVQGAYMLQLPAAVLNLTGALTYAVQVAGARTFVGTAKVVAKEEADTFASVAGVAVQMARALGLMHENSVLDNTTFNADNNLTAGRFRTYDTKAHALAAGVLGLVATYTIAATYTGKLLTTYSVVIEP